MGFECLLILVLLVARSVISESSESGVNSEPRDPKVPFRFKIIFSWKKSCVLLINDLRSPVESS